MDWMILVAIIAGGTIASFTDWLFMGVLFHERYNKYPEVWWPGIRGGKDQSAVIKSAIVGYLGSAGIVLLCWFTNEHGLRETLTVAVLAWLAGTLPVLVTNGFFIKFDPALTVTHSLGWLARSLITAVAFTLLVPR